MKKHQAMCITRTALLASVFFPHKFAVPEVNSWRFIGGPNLSNSPKVGCPMRYPRKVQKNFYDTIFKRENESETEHRITNDEFLNPKLLNPILRSCVKQGKILPVLP